MTDMVPPATHDAAEIERLIGRSAESIIRKRADGTLTRDEADAEGIAHVRIADLARMAVKLTGRGHL